MVFLAEYLDCGLPGGKLFWVVLLGPGLKILDDRRDFCFVFFGVVFGFEFGVQLDGVVGYPVDFGVIEHLCFDFGEGSAFALGFLGDRGDEEFFGFAGCLHGLMIRLADGQAGCGLALEIYRAGLQPSGVLGARYLGLRPRL